MSRNMKNLLFTSVLLLSIIGLTAQEKTTVDSDNITNKVITKDDSIILGKKTVSIDKVCYGEASKVAFYEALICQNGFDIQLKESDALVIKSTEEIISKTKDQILYTEED